MVAKRVGMHRRIGFRLGFGWVVLLLLCGCANTGEKQYQLSSDEWLNGNYICKALADSLEKKVSPAEAGMAAEEYLLRPSIHSLFILRPGETLRSYTLRPLSAQHAEITDSAGNAYGSVALSKDNPKELILTRQGVLEEFVLTRIDEVYVQDPVGDTLHSGLRWLLNHKLFVGEYALPNGQSVVMGPDGSTTGLGEYLRYLLTFSNAQPGQTSPKNRIIFYLRDEPHLFEWERKEGALILTGTGEQKKEIYILK